MADFSSRICALSVSTSPTLALSALISAASSSLVSARTAADEQVINKRAASPAPAARRPNAGFGNLAK
jgi:hypothetical protein